MAEQKNRLSEVPGEVVNNNLMVMSNHSCFKCLVLSTLSLCSIILGECSFAQLLQVPKAGIMAGQPGSVNGKSVNGLLFYLSGDKDFTADFAAGDQVYPNYLKDVDIIPEGALGKGFRAKDSQLLSYWAPGNIFAQRGTLSFFWRSGYPVGPTPFPVFRVGYADHSSWDMVWLRIDYNGSGFDAFITDIGLARTRVSCYLDKFPDHDDWTHLTLSWDETAGIKFYINGRLAGQQTSNGTIYDSGLDQFGPHSRIISPYQVQSAYNFTRGGDIDEIRIYDHMLTDESIETLAKGKEIKKEEVFFRDLDDRRWRDEWWLLNGWNIPNPPPALLPSSESSIRKVEIHDAYDIKRWFWKANDGIRETTWPGVYNMSRLPGRYDYFVLPDWDCYSGSGQSVRFTLPDEQWNHVEIWGKAWGQMTLESQEHPDYTFAVRTRDQIKSYHQLNQSQFGGTIRFDNALIEEPIGSFEVYNIINGHAPEGAVYDSFLLNPLSGEINNKALADVFSFVCGRYPSDERSMMLGVPVEIVKKLNSESVQKNSYPLIHIAIPYAGHSDSGLDGIEIQFPIMNVIPTHSGVFPLNIRVKDPLWLMRDLADFSFSIKPGDSPKLWIDLRDRILPKEGALYISIAGAGADLTPELLKGTRIRLIYKSREEASSELELDRFTQIRDLYAHIVEERPNNPRLNLYNRFIADCNDLLAVNPDHWLGQTYRYALTGENKPAYKIPDCPDDIPEWAFLQVEYLRHLELIANYYIDHRQIANGEFGGGLSDDGDLTNNWPVMAFLGIEPEKILNSLSKHMAAYYDQERPAEYVSYRQRSLPLITNGLATIFTDELHALEEGMQVVGQMMLLDYGTPLYLERGMETASRMLNDITQINPDGHRHFRTRYYGGTRIALEDPWQWSLNHSYHVLQTSYLLARYNGNRELRKMIIELADALLEHRRDGKLFTEINFATDESRDDTGNTTKPWSLFIAAYNLTGNKKYLEPLPVKPSESHEFDKKAMAERYREEISNLGIRDYINTEGSVWIDRVSQFNPFIQQDRLGGTALLRVNALYPQNYVSWEFNSPATYESTAIFVPKASPDTLEIIAYNLEKNMVSAEMTVWNVNPGRWRVCQGLDTNDDRLIDSAVSEKIIYLERGESLNLLLSPRKYNIVSMQLIEIADRGYWDRSDLGLGPSDIIIEGSKVIVRIHSLGAVASPATTLVLKDGNDKVVASGLVPPLESPSDLVPKWTDIILYVNEGTDLSSGSVEVDPEKKINQITRRNTIVKW